VDFANAVPVVVARPFLAVVVDGEARALPVVQVVVGVALVRVHLGPRRSHPQHHRLDRLRRAPVGLSQPNLTGLAPDHPEDRRSVVVEGAIAR
jgi:hypothetical protein